MTFPTGRTMLALAVVISLGVLPLVHIVTGVLLRACGIHPTPARAWDEWASDIDPDITQELTMTPALRTPWRYRGRHRGRPTGHVFLAALHRLRR